MPKLFNFGYLFVMQSAKTKKRKNLKHSRSFDCEMPVTDTTILNSLDDCIIFPVEEIVQYPLPGYGAPTSISFSPDDSLITYLFSSDNSLNRKVFTFDLETCKQELVFGPPDGGLDESNISAEEKLRRERSRERGLGVTRYEWVKTSLKKKTIMVPSPAGVCFFISDVNLSLLVCLAAWNLSLGIGFRSHVSSRF